jgi:hypothetical protein
MVHVQGEEGWNGTAQTFDSIFAELKTTLWGRTCTELVTVTIQYSTGQMSYFKENMRLSNGIQRGAVTLNITSVLSTFFIVFLEITFSEIKKLVLYADKWQIGYSDMVPLASRND